MVGSRSMRIDTQLHLEVEDSYSSREGADEPRPTYGLTA